MPVRRSLERQLLLGFTLPVLAIITVTVLSLTAFYEYRLHAQTVTHTRDVIDQVRTLQLLERQWLIAPTEDRREAFDRAWTETFALLRDNPQQRQRLRQWRDNLRQSEGEALSVRLQRTLPVAQELVDVENALLARRRAVTQQRVDAAQWAVLIGLPLTATLGAALGILMLRRVRSLTTPLLRATERVQAGDLSVRVPVTGRDELSVIAQHFNDMTASLQRTVQEQRALQRTLEERVESLVQASTTELQALSQLGLFMQACETQVEAAEVIARVAPALFPLGGSVSLLAESRNMLERFTAWGGAPEGGAWLPEECWASRLGTDHAAGPDLNAPRCRHDRSELGTLCLTLSAQGETLGVVTLHFPDGPAAAQAQALARRFTDRLALSLANLRLKETLRHQSVRDPLTGLYNRRYFEETGERELARAERQGWPLSVMMLDVDHFKQFNDVHGHAVGDMVLRRLGHVLGRLFREDDVVCRYGGEEFVVLLPNCGAGAALERAEALRVAAGALVLAAPDSSGLTVTVSVGVTTTTGDRRDLNALVREADQALYRAKAQGRNRVAAYHAE
ncbi:diguanylate cyclase [Deinococcus sp. ME38]|uniref:GGDEF domain-containing protein n=1 Tax=Deinococcus sp. ME38 TaxID=3400344 RepID=UPI003B5BDC41